MIHTLNSLHPPHCQALDLIELLIGLLFNLLELCLGLCEVLFGLGCVNSRALFGEK